MFLTAAAGVCGGRLVEPYRSPISVCFHFSTLIDRQVADQ
jgi:hypothetical protein